MSTERNKSERARHMANVKGYSVTHIARTLGMSPYLVRKALSRKGVKHNHQPRKPRCEHCGGIIRS